MSGSSWAPSACCERSSPFLYRTAHTADEALTLPQVSRPEQQWFASKCICE
jgi:hypothetical protein